MANAKEDSTSDSEYLSSSTSEEEEEFDVFDSNGKAVDLEPNSRKVQIKVPLIRRRGKRGM